MSVDERTFVALVASWINEILARRHDLPYGEARVEEPLVGTRKRLDLTVFRRDLSSVALTGEVKMPDRPYGKSHLDGELVGDAFEKASRLGSDYYFTWNVNRFALFETHQANVPFTERRIEDREVVQIETSDEVNVPAIQDRIKSFWEDLLDTLHRIETGERDLLNLPLDSRFVLRLGEALAEPSELAYQVALAQYARDGEFRQAMDAWLRNDQGWDVPSGTEDLARTLKRAAKLSCYILANRLVFYEVLRRRFPELDALRDLPLGTRGQELAAVLNRQFLRAIEVSHDYETIFGSQDFGSGLPFISDKAVPAWARLIDGIEDFDFTRLDYDVIGRLYEQLISPEERARWGQFFTKPEVVDRINAFCIREPEAKVMDPACGGGTFLVRAYARKRVLAEQAGAARSHQELLADLYGVDVASFPAQLSTINLASRHLAAEANYPRVVRDDFFNLQAGKSVAILPIGLGGEGQPVAIDDLDAVVGNPPYIRQEEIDKQRKQHLANVVGGEYAGQIRLSGRSDLYVYFFPHAAAFLRDGGYMGLVTSVGWLDTEYGFRLQEFLLRNFRIIAVLESQVEKWFEDARVTTAVTILQKESNEAIRENNLVRFVQLRRPLAEIYSFVLKGSVSKSDEAKRQGEMDSIRDLLEETTTDTLTDYWRVRVVSQSELWRRGCQVRLSKQASKGSGAESYEAGKWGQFIRASDAYFELLDRCGDRLVPLSDLAEVAFGFKTGVDKFFCVRDVTDDEIHRARSTSAFKRKWAITVEDTSNVRIIQAGDGSLHLVEAKFLEPEFHRLAEATHIAVTANDVKKLVINAPVARASLRKTHLGKYVDYAEQQKPAWHEGATVASRAKTRQWYDLGLAPKAERAPIFWPKSQQYRHLVPWNGGRLPCNCNLYDVWPEAGIEARLLWAVLNSSVVALLKQQVGRLAGIEGSLKTEVVDVKMLLVPDPRAGTPRVAERVVAAAKKLARRPLRRFLYEEFELQDRQELDDAVLELLGIRKSAERSALRHRIYSAIEAEQRATREREIIAQKDRARSKKKGTITPEEQATDIWETDRRTLKLQEFPRDFVRSRRRSIRVDLPSGKVEVGQAMFDTGKHLAAGTIRVGGSSGDVIDVGSVAKAEFLEAAAECGHIGVVQVLREDEECLKAVYEYRRYKKELEEHFADLAAQRTNDAKRQRAITKALMTSALTWRRD